MWLQLMWVPFMLNQGQLKHAGSVPGLGVEIDSCQFALHFLGGITSLGEV